MILVDTSIWIDFFKGKSAAKFLKELLEDDNVRVHPYIIGELLLGGLSHTDKNLFDSISMTEAIETDIVETFIIQKKLSGKGIGYLDSCLLCNCLAEDLLLATFDKKLNAIATKLHLAYL